jgi:hypothetical protein
MINVKVVGNEKRYHRLFDLVKAKYEVVAHMPDHKKKSYGFVLYPKGTDLVG